MQKIFSADNPRGRVMRIHADLPDKSAAGKPFVLAVHGLDSNLHEYGLYDTVADSLAGVGIACLRFDFPGNGESAEPFTCYTHKNMLDDMDCVRDFAVNTLGLSPVLFGVQGYSMGGRAACLYTARHPEISCLSLWAPGVTPGVNVIKSFLRDEPDLISAYKAIAANGVFSYDPFGVHDLQFSAEFFRELKHSDPLEVLDSYRGDVFCAMGCRDTVVDPRDMALVSVYCESARSLEMVKFSDGGHDFGTAYGRGTQNAEIINVLTSKTAAYFVRHLCI